MYLSNLGININDDTEYNEEWIKYDLETVISQFWRIKIDKLPALIKYKEPLNEIKDIIGNAYIISRYLELEEPIAEWTEETVELILTAIERHILNLKCKMQSLDFHIKSSRYSIDGIIYDDSLDEMKISKQLCEEHIKYYNYLIEGIKEARGKVK